MIFCFDDYSDLLEKAKYNRSQINTSSELEKNDFYPIFDTIFMLNHLFEWYYKDESINKSNRIECIKCFNPYFSKNDQRKNFSKLFSLIEDKLRVNTNQMLIRKLSNNMKHYNMTYIKKTDKLPLYLPVAGNMSCGSANAYAGYFEEYKYVITTENEHEHDLLIIINNLISEWDSFITKRNNINHDITIE